MRTEEQRKKHNEYMRNYYKKNPDKYQARLDKSKEYSKKYHEEHKEEEKQYKIKYNEENREKVLKSKRIYNWKRRGIISENYNVLYDKYINTNNCELCNVELINGSGWNNKKHLDHDHETGEFRNILCGKCNVRRI